MDTIKTTIQVPVQHPCFAGHFPGNPIVPGALLLQWILQVLREQLAGCDIKAVSSVKFTASLTPGDCCELLIHYPAGSEKIRLTCQSAKGLICKAVIVLEPPAETC